MISYATLKSGVSDNIVTYNIVSYSIAPNFCKSRVIKCKPLQFTDKSGFIQSPSGLIINENCTLALIAMNVSENDKCQYFIWLNPMSLDIVFITYNSLIKDYTTVPMMITGDPKQIF